MARKQQSVDVDNEHTHEALEKKVADLEKEVAALKKELAKAKGGADPDPRVDKIWEALLEYDKHGFSKRLEK